VTTPTLDRITPVSNAQPVQTGGMVALVPAAEYAVKLAVAGGLPAGELHLTLCYLGDDVTTWPPEVVDAVRQAALEITDPAATDGEAVPAGLTQGPLALNIFAWSQFNPNGGPNGQEPCMVYQFSGDGDYTQVENLALQMQAEMKDVVGEAFFPKQHARFEPHITAGYGLPPTALTYTGPVVFDRLRVALGGDIIDMPLGGDGSMVAGSALSRTPSGSVTAKSRAKAKAAGHAMPDGSFPIENGADLDRAIKLAGKAKDPVAARKHIMAQAKRLKLTFKIPDSWQADGSLKASAAVTAAAESEPSLTIDDDQRAALTAAATALLEKLGPVEAYRQAPLVFFSPESLAVADEVIEPPEVDDALTAAGDAVLPSIDLFTPPQDMPPGTGHYVDPPTAEGKFRRVYGRLAEWDVPHIGIDGRKVYPPRSASGYRWFHTKSAWVQGLDGPERIKIGHLTFGTGHAPTAPGVGHLAAAAHYDNSGYRGAKVRMSEDEYGPVYAGVTVAGLDGERLEEFSESDTSGDWRRIMGSLELVAALCVNVGGFPKVGLSLAASGEPLALVASAKSWGQSAAVDYDALADAMVARMEHRQAVTAALTSKKAVLLAELDDSPARMKQLLAEFEDDDTSILVAAVGEPTENDLAKAVAYLTAAGPKKNWVEKAGGLPQYIKRIAKHLQEKGMTQSRAIATAVNVAKKMCAEGDLNYPGIQHVNPGSRAEACAAVADWERKKAQSHAN
jgi:hypothetical protein